MWVQEVPPVHGLENQSDDRLQVKVSRHFSKVPLEHQSSCLSIGMTLHLFDQGVFSDRRSRVSTALDHNPIIIHIVMFDVLGCGNDDS